MHYKKIIFLILFLLITNCSSNTLLDKKINLKIENSFINRGFTLVYNDQLYKNKLISKKIDSRSLLIFQKNLKKGTSVKITNILNKKSLIAKVGENSSYPSFNNSVISLRLAEELELNNKEPYVQIISIQENSLFIAKKAKTYEEEKNVANKAPIESISIIDSINTNDLEIKKTKLQKINKNKFSYNIKVADFYFNKTALQMVDRIIKETNFVKPKIKKISNKKYRVYLGPFNNINSLQKSFNDIEILEFENIEFIQND
jgi:hypothetical protein